MLSLAFLTASVAGSAYAGAAARRRSTGSKRFMAEVLAYDGASGFEFTHRSREFDDPHVPVEHRSTPQGAVLEPGNVRVREITRLCGAELLLLEHGGQPRSCRFLPFLPGCQLFACSRRLGERT